MRGTRPATLLDASVYIGLLDLVSNIMVCPSDRWPDPDLQEKVLAANSVVDDDEKLAEMGCRSL
jgi:hypothetical protein